MGFIDKYRMVRKDLLVRTEMAIIRERMMTGVRDRNLTMKSGTGLKLQT